MIMQDKLEKDRADSKNAVEEYVYEMRSKLSETLREFITDQVSGWFLFWVQEILTMPLIG